MQEKRYSRVTDRFLISQLVGETVLMDKVSGEYLGINAMGTVIWEQLAATCTLTDIVTRLLERFEVDEPTCRNEVEQFLSLLEIKKMLIVEA